jgi:hypothetical protein
MTTRTQQNDLFQGLVHHIIEKGMIILQYLVDTILCLDNDLEKGT